MPDENDITFSQYNLDWGGVLRAFLELGGGSPISADRITDYLELIWAVAVVYLLILLVLFFAGYIYAATRYNELSAIELEGIKAEEKRWQQLYGSNQPSRFDDIKQHIASENPNDWKLAIIEADIELERLLEKVGYPGNTIGEKLKGANKDTFTTLQDAWDAHTVRNKIAHQGADFVLTNKIARDTIARYQRVFTEFDHR
jgi:hypothetical protein